MRIWLTHEARRPGELLLLAFVTIIVGIVVAVAAARYIPSSIVPIGMRPMYLYVSFADFFMDVARRYILVVLFEEVLFCALPVSLAYTANRWRSTLVILGGSALLFGFYPGHAVFPFEVQCGIVLCRILLILLYLKMGGWSRDIRWKALLAVVAAHYATGLATFYLATIKYMLLLE